VQGDQVPADVHRNLLSHDPMKISHNNDNDDLDDGGDLVLGGEEDNSECGQEPETEGDDGYGDE